MSVFSSLTSPPSLVQTISPFISPSVPEVSAASLQRGERVQHQEYVGEHWLTARDLTNDGWGGRRGVP